jgi:hypothetical protein
VEYSGRSTEDLLAELEQRRRGGLQEDVDDEDDIIRRFVPADQYAKLSEAQRSDLALKRWRESRKSNWQIGRDYERAIGYEFEGAGYVVEYFGAVKGLEDLGRDLIAMKDDITYLIQCKYWSQRKEIHEKHIFQLIGTAFEYACNRLSKPINGLGSVDIRGFPRTRNCDSRSQLREGDLDSAGTDGRAMGAHREACSGQRGRQGTARRG